MVEERDVSWGGFLVFGGVAEGKRYISEKDIQSALWGQPAAMLPLPVYR